MLPRASASLSLGNTASQGVQLINKLVIAATLYFGAQLVIDGNLTVGELVAFNILAGRVSTPVLRSGSDLARLSPGALVGGAARRHPQHHAGADL